MTDATRELLRQRAAGVGVNLSDQTINGLGRFAELLLQWNQKINLTACKSIEELIERHVVDSLALQPLVQPNQKIVDVGAGGGFPGAVLGLVEPSARITCVDSIQKKVSFLEAVRRTTAPNLTPICGRIEGLIPQLGVFDLVVSRATFAPAEWVAIGSPLVAPGGLLVTMLTEDAERPPAPAEFTPDIERSYEIDQGRIRRVQAYRRCST